MANRDLSTVVNTPIQPVTPATPNALEGVADVGLKIIDTSQQAKINENISKAQVDLAGLDEKYRIDAQADPFNSQLKADYMSNRQSVLAGYKGDISPVYRMQFDQDAQKLTTNSDVQLEGWRYKQAANNTQDSIKTSMTTNFLQANKNGLSYGTGDGSDLATHLMDFKVSQDQLGQFATKNMGAESSQQLLKDYQKDYMKAFVSGVTQSDPAKADQILKDPEVSKLFDSKEMEEMHKVMLTTVKQKDLTQLISQNDNASKTIGIVNGQGSYMDKRLQIDTMEMNNQISTEVAEKARRVLTSEKAVDAITHTDKMAGVITQMYDLNALKESSSGDYIKGVQNIRGEIMDSQTNGDLSPEDAHKLNSQLDQLSSARLAKATQRVGINFYDQKEKFNVLPPQYRGEAVREMFNQTNGKEMSSNDMGKVADTIIDNIRTRSRNTAIKNVQQLNDGSYPPPLASPAPGAASPTLTPPLAFNKAKFMKDNGINAADVAETAKKHNVSEDQVVHDIWQQKNGQGRK